MDELLDRYTRLLGVQTGEPSIAGLSRLVAAHMMRIPFENISKLYYLRTAGSTEIPPLDQFLDGIERYHFGGTCYANGFHVHQLLKYLDYDVDLCGADMSQPDVHLVNVVRVEEREFIVDVGYGAPFLKPLPRDLSIDYITFLGEGRYVLSPIDGAGWSLLTFYEDNIARHGYRVNPKPRDIHEFSHVVADSFRSSATFMNAILLVRFDENSSLVLRNKTLTESNGAAMQKRTLEFLDDVIDVIERRFGIPAAMSAVALEGLSFNQDAWD